MQPQALQLNEIQDLIKFVAKSGVSEVELQIKDFKITIKTPAGSSNAPILVQAAPQVNTAPIVQTVAAPVAETKASEQKKETPASTTDESKYITIKSPMIGTFYRSAGPDKPPFVNVGDEIKPGKVICIIEAMKLFNEIEADIKGKIVKVLANDATPVEYDQPLFLVDPS
ncbi:MAG: acetyl-CoA carboxylase biotin carboxyl carrier protein [Bacteroidetes bacterium]|nr:acetyl-CoA carboxylase biotin carboxyl carrier protein [Bacteroidota bacterium]